MTCGPQLSKEYGGQDGVLLENEDGKHKRLHFTNGSRTRQPLQKADYLMKCEGLRQEVFDYVVEAVCSHLRRIINAIKGTRWGLARKPVLIPSIAAGW